MTDRIIEHSDNYEQSSFIWHDVLVTAKVQSEYINNIYAVSGQRLDIYSDKKNCTTAKKTTYRPPYLIIAMFYIFY
jgi:hypothetical protein